MVAQEFAVTWPERVEKLVLMCTSAGGDAGSSYPLHELGNLPTNERAQKITELTDTRFTPEWLASHPRDARMMTLRAEQAAVPKSEEVLRGERLQLQARIGHDVADRLHLITAPRLSQRDDLTASHLLLIHKKSHRVSHLLNYASMKAVICLLLKIPMPLQISVSS